MKPPILQTDWMNRVALDPERAAEHVESFYIKANDPKHRRALWLRLSLFADGKEKYGECWAIFFDGETGQHRAAKERWPMDRVQIDPERAGVGIGESAIEEGQSTGVVRGADFAIASSLRLKDEVGPYRPLPAKWMYRPRLLNAKFVTPHPSASVSGDLELWAGLSRHTDMERIVLDGWRGMQGHVWGRRNAERFVWSHCNAFDEAPQGAFFEAFSGQVQVGGTLSRPITTGRLVVDGKTYRFDTWRNLLSNHTQFNPTGWSFEMSGPDGTIKGKLEGDPKDTVGVVLANPDAAPSHVFNSKLARLTLELTPEAGSKRTLHSDKAALEVALPDAKPGIQTVL